MATDADALSVSFSQFIISLATSALVHLGQQADPATGATAVNLPLAHQTIDVLSVLETKTKGNLDDAEQELCDRLLFELRSKFVEVSRAQG